MPDPDATADQHGLASLARRWSETTLRRGSSAAKALDTLADSVGISLNVLIDLAKYTPIILDPTRCLDNDVQRILEYVGIDYTGLTVDQRRRIAIIGNEIKHWRGAHRSIRAIVSAITGENSMVLPWLLDRFVLDESTLTFYLLSAIDDDINLNTIYYIADDTSLEKTLTDQLTMLAMQVKEQPEYIRCFDMTAWKDGTAGWPRTGNWALVPSDVFGEFQALDFGNGLPDAVAGANIITSPRQHPSPSSATATFHSTAWFVTSNHTEKMHLTAFSTVTTATAGQSAYSVRLQMGNNSIEFLRIIAGTTTVLATFSAPCWPGYDEDWHRLDLIVIKEASQTKLRAFVDHNPTVWVVDSTVSPRPEGGYGNAMTFNATAPNLVVRLAALSFRELE
jgi:hypothetical protein